MYVCESVCVWPNTVEVHGVHKWVKFILVSVCWLLRIYVYVAWFLVLWTCVAPAIYITYDQVLNWLLCVFLPFSYSRIMCIREPRFSHILIIVFQIKRWCRLFIFPISIQWEQVDAHRFHILLNQIVFNIIIRQYPMSPWLLEVQRMSPRAIGGAAK